MRATKNEEIPTTTRRIACLEGDLAGKEVAPFGHAVLTSVNEVNPGSFELEDFPYDARYYVEHGEPWPEGTEAEIKSSFDGVMLTALGDSKLIPGDAVMDQASAIILDFARGNGYSPHPDSLLTNFCERPFTAPHPTLALSPDKRPVDFKIFQLDGDGVEVSEKIEVDTKGNQKVLVTERYSLSAFKKVLEQGIEEAKHSNDGRIAVVLKHNVLRYAHTPFLHHTRERMKSLPPGVTIELHLADSFCERLLKNPTPLPKVIVTDRTFGHMISPVLDVLRSGDRGVVPYDLHGIIGRENIEGQYIRRGWIEDGSTPGIGEKVGESIGVQISQHSSKLIAENIRASIRVAQAHGWNKITVLHNGDIYPETFKLLTSVANRVGKEEGVTINYMKASEFFVIAASNPAELHQGVFPADNLIGDVCGDQAVALTGGLGVAPTLSRNTDGRTNKVYAEPLHGTAPDIAGQDKANPIAMVLSAGKLLGYFGHSDHEQSLNRAVFDVIEDGAGTPDMPNRTKVLGTKEFGQRIINQFKRMLRG